MPCIFQEKEHEVSKEGSLNVVVEGCGQVGRGPRRGDFRGRCAKPDTPLSLQLAG